MRRRQLLLATGVALSTTVAGCAGEDSVPDGGTGSETNETGAEGTDGDENGTDDGNDAGAEDEASDDDDETEADADGVEDDDVDPEDDPFDADDSPIEGLRIIDDELVEDSYSRSVVGTVVNDSGEDLASIEIAAAFYDADGNRVDENTTNAGGMDDGDALPIEIKSFEDEIVDYEVAIVNADPHEQILE